jgi:hypothetical protein
LMYRARRSSASYARGQLKSGGADSLLIAFVG